MGANRLPLQDEVKAGDNEARLAATTESFFIRLYDVF